MNGASDHLLQDLLDRVQSRFYGKYRGTVTDIEDSTLRIKAKVPAVLHEQETGWCTPCVPYAGDQVGLAFLPEVGAGVWIEFEGGDVSCPIWTGCYWRDGEIPSDARPAVKAIITKAGHKLLLDDDAESITVSDPNNNTITLDSSGLTLKHGSQQVLISDSGIDVNNGALEVSGG